MIIEIGKEYKSLKCGNFIILKNYGYGTYYIEFCKTKYKRTVSGQRIKTKNVRDKYRNTVFNIGFEGDSEYNFIKNKIPNKIWRDMLRRCYYGDQNWYKNSTVCAYWHNFQNFCNWFYSKESNYQKGYHLDKDLYIENNHEYGPLTCIFVSRDINNVFIKTKTFNKKLPIGVVERSSGYFSICSVKGKQIKGKIRNTIKESELDYLKMKIEYITNDLMIRKSFPDKILYSVFLRVKIMIDRITILEGQND